MSSRDAGASAAELPIRRVRTDGTVEQLGTWRPQARRLELTRDGFPLVRAGTHAVDGDIPWQVQEIAPDGFLAALFVRWFPELHLPPDPKLWSPSQVTTAISERGHDLAGNLLIGEESHQRFLRVFRGSSAAGPSREEASRHFDRLVEQALSSPLQSSVGGARPKFALRLADGSGLIVKFTPPLDTAAGGRWADLLRVEALAAAVLRDAGLDAVQAAYVEQGERGYLMIDRFDRLAGGGRAGHVTLYFLGAALYGEPANPALVVANLVRDGHLTRADEERFTRLHAFSQAIGNTDAHQGNYGLLFDDAGTARLAPAYDVVPMAFAPRHDELPDRFVKAAPRGDAETRALVEELVRRVKAEGGFGGEFREAWIRSVQG